MNIKHAKFLKWLIQFSGSNWKNCWQNNEQWRQLCRLIMIWTCGKGKYFVVSRRLKVKSLIHHACSVSYSVEEIWRSLKSLSCDGFEPATSKSCAPLPLPLPLSLHDGLNLQPPDPMFPPPLCILKDKCLFTIICIINRAVMPHYNIWL